NCCCTPLAALHFRNEILRDQDLALPRCFYMAKDPHPDRVADMAENRHIFRPPSPADWQTLFQSCLLAPRYAFLLHLSCPYPTLFRYSETAGFPCHWHADRRDLHPVKIETCHHDIF